MATPLPPAELRPAPPSGAVRYGAGMLRRFGWLYRLLGLGSAMRRVRLGDSSVDRIRTAAAKGPVAYVLLERSALDHLALNAVLVRRRLPLSVWSNGPASRWWRPIADAWRETFARWRARLTLGRRPDPVTSGWLAAQVASGATTTIFLQEAGVAVDPTCDPLLALLEAQERLDVPVQLVPVLVVWDKSPESQQGSVVRDFLLGNREAPNHLTRLTALYLPSAKPFVQVGEPLDLAEFLRRAHPARRLDTLRTLLRRYLKRESRVVRGPQLVPRPVLRTLVLDAPPMRRFAEDEARTAGQPVDSVRRRMAREFDLIAANFSWPVILFLSVVCRPLWNRVFNGYDIRSEDLERIRAAAREGTAVLVPCHKSHFDYLLLSWILYWDDLIVPHVVAGMNLAIWPIHYLLRASGGFFIRRSFAGERVHAAVFSRYLRELLLHGYTVEFFIEGGRTRTGRLMPPKLGVLEMVLDAAVAAPPGREITLLPIAITYEQVAEEGSYEAELGGREKKAESMGELIKARSVLTRRFGKIFVRVGEPVKASDVRREAEAAGTEATSREVLRTVGERLVHRIGTSTVVLPTSLVALALLAHHRLGIRHDELVGRLIRFHALLRRRGAMAAPPLARFDAAIRVALERFARDGRVRALGTPDDRIWETVPSQRVMLDFYKNQIAHFVAAPAIAAAVLRAQATDRVQPADLLDDWIWATRLLRREWIADPDRTDAAHLDAALDDLVAHGAVQRDADGAIVVVSVERVAEVHGLVRALLESYLLVARQVLAHGDRKVDAKAATKALHAAQESQLAAGAVTRPEAFADVALKNAIAALVEDGLVTKDADGLRATPERLAAAESRLARMAGLA